MSRQKLARIELLSSVYQDMWMILSVWPSKKKAKEVMRASCKRVPSLKKRLRVVLAAQVNPSVPYVGQPVQPVRIVSAISG